MSKPYKTCPDCGAHLDSGEICDCRKEEKNMVATFVATMPGPEPKPTRTTRHNDLVRCLPAFT